jgi:hypothetical protein
MLCAAVGKQMRLGRACQITASPAREMQFPVGVLQKCHYVECARRVVWTSHAHAFSHSSIGISTADAQFTMLSLGSAHPVGTMIIVPACQLP